MDRVYARFDLRTALRVLPLMGNALVKTSARARKGSMVTTCVPINAYRETLLPMSSQLPAVVI